MDGIQYSAPRSMRAVPLLKPSMPTPSSLFASLPPLFFPIPTTRHPPGVHPFQQACGGDGGEFAHAAEGPQRARGHVERPRGHGPKHLHQRSPRGKVFHTGGGEISEAFWV